jgi:hypothetical protein
MRRTQAITGRRRILFVVVLLPTTLVAGGCDRGPTLKRVRGKVTLADGRPVHNGTVTLYPDAAKGNKSQELPVGQVDEQGVYTVMTGPREGAPPGWYRVAISAAEKMDPNNLYVTKWLIHEKYTNPETSRLTMEVVDKPEPGRYDFQVEPHLPQQKR